MDKIETEKQWLETTIGDRDLAELPFLPQAASVIKAKYPRLSLAELAERTEYKSIFELGVKRASSAIVEGKTSVDGVLEDPADKILTFVIASVLVKLINNDLLTKRYALAEAKRAERFLFSKLSEDRFTAQALLNVLYASLADISIKNVWFDVGSQLLDVTMDVKDFLRLSSNINAPEWRLANQIVYQGNVYLKLEQTIRLLRGLIASYIERKIDSLKIASLPKRYLEEAENIKKQLAERTSLRYPPFSYIVSGEALGNYQHYPPCILQLLKKMDSGENLPHFARFLLAAFLINIGVPLDNILTLFSKLPDFNEKITRYQLEHIAGKKGSGTKYMVPSCNKIASMGLCYPNNKCKNINNPLTYYAKSRKEEREKQQRENTISRKNASKGRYKRKRKGIPEEEL